MKVLVTGGSRGIGKAIVAIYRENAHEVIAPMRDELELGSTKSIDSFVEHYKTYEFDAIVNNAGINPLNEIDKITDADIEACMQINLVAPLMLCRGFVPSMKAKKYGRIVNIGSIWGVVSKPGRAVYAATKNGIHGLTNTLAAELGEYNILVNTLCPGFTKTELTAQNITAQEEETLGLNIPLKRFAAPSEIAKAVYWLGSGENTYINGQKIVIDGGFSAI